MEATNAGEAGIIALCKALETGACPQLQHLDLAHNGICDTGIIALSKAFDAGACPQLLYCMRKATMQARKVSLR